MFAKKMTFDPSTTLLRVCDLRIRRAGERGLAARRLAARASGETGKLAINQ